MKFCIPSTFRRFNLHRVNGAAFHATARQNLYVLDACGPITSIIPFLPKSSYDRIINNDAANTNQPWMPLAIPIQLNIVNVQT